MEDAEQCEITIVTFNQTNAPNLPLFVVAQLADNSAQVYIWTISFCTDTKVTERNAMWLYVPFAYW